MARFSGHSVVLWAHLSPHRKRHLNRFSRFGATVYKTVRPMLPDRCLFVTVVYCRQTVGWIRMPLGMVGLGPGHIVLYDDTAPPKKKEGAQQPPLFGPCLLWPHSWMDQDATWYGW